MVGYPSETREDFLMTKRLIRKIHPDIVAISITTPMLGTDLYDFAKENRMLNITTYSDFGYYGQNSPLKLEHLTNEEVVEFKKKIVVEYFKNLYKNIFKYINIFLLRHGQKRKFYFSIIKRSLKARIKWLNF